MKIDFYTKNKYFILKNGRSGDNFAASTRESKILRGEGFRKIKEKSCELSKTEFYELDPGGWAIKSVQCNGWSKGCRYTERIQHPNPRPTTNKEKK